MARGLTLRGMIPYNALSEDLGGFREVLRPGCFSQSLSRGDDVLARREHITLFLLGRRSSGTLRIQDSADALRYDIELTDVGAGAETAALAQRGDLRSSSFAFVVEDTRTGERWSKLPDGTPLREVLACRLFDVAPVAEPAYPAAGLSPRAGALEAEHRIAPTEARAAGLAHGLAVELAGRPWAILGEIAAQARDLVATQGPESVRHVGVYPQVRALARVSRGVHAFDRRPELRAVAPESVAIIPVIGTLTQRGGAVASADTRSVAAIVDELDVALLDPKVRAIVLEVDSPGGEVFGVPEAWAAIRAAAQLKPVVAHANSFAASAAYYLASAATEIHVAPSGQVGSIGVYMLHVDRSRRIEQSGERWTFVSAGRYKVEGNSALPLSDEARAQMQRAVDSYYDAFVRDVAAGRGAHESAVRGGFGEGRMVLAGDAVAAGMADRVGTFAQALLRAQELGRGKAPERSRPAVTGVPLEVLRMRNDLAVR